MQESQRTLVFVGAAVISVVLAAATYRATQPAPLAEFSDVGEPFYPDFDDPNEATGLRVAAYNEDAAKVDVFNVEFKDGLWRIPSHHNYPADGEEQLSKTATSIIGIERSALASTSSDDFKRFGVLDPLDESVTGTEGRGDRITLFEGDNVLADYIIGNKVEDQTDVYHIRRPDEERTYRASLDIDISTKFADWIEPDLLDVTRGDLREIVIDNYSIDEARGALIPGEQSQLKRPNSTDPWVLDGLAEGEEVNTTNVNSIINALEDLKIVGVRPKPPGLSADLKGESKEGARIDTLAFLDLQEKGYFIDAEGALVSNEGEVRVGTADGVLYVLRFGEVFTGSDVEIEVGSEKDAPTEGTEESSGDEAAEDESTEEGSEDEEADSTKQSRYLFITTQFHEALIEPLGEKPVEPEKRSAEETEEAADAETDADEGAESTDDEPAEDGDADTAATDKDAEYKKAFAEYETSLKQWESEKSAYDKKIEDGKEKVKELSIRFADWYYVISSDTFDDIRVDRTELIKVKEPEEGEDDTTAADAPALAPPTTDPASDETPEPEPASTSEPETSDDTPSADAPAPESKGDADEPEDLPDIDEEKLPEGEPGSPAPEAESEEDANE
ncbi:MAG: DUF4340 domain-containing protein [Planctomycetaceae bacterium]|nr:DUF4340 domain-containing protein [Planctomycetaceae bacterium]